jgi:hypothetical protein
VDEEFSSEDFDRIFIRDDIWQDKERMARLARKNHVRRSIEDYSDTRRMRKLLGDFY